MEKKTARGCDEEPYLPSPEKYGVSLSVAAAVACRESATITSTTRRWRRGERRRGMVVRVRWEETVERFTTRGLSCNHAAPGSCPLLPSLSLHFFLKDKKTQSWFDMLIWWRSVGGYGEGFKWREWQETRGRNQGREWEWALWRRGSWKESERRSETRGTPGLERASLSRRVAVSFVAPLTAAATWWHLARVFFYFQVVVGGVAWKSSVATDSEEW